MKKKHKLKDSPDLLEKPCLLTTRAGTNKGCVFPASAVANAAAALLAMSF
jgi:hypothetical protein